MKIKGSQPKPPSVPNEPKNRVTQKLNAQSERSVFWKRGGHARLLARGFQVKVGYVDMSFLAEKNPKK